MSESEIVATEFVVPGTDKTKYMCELCKISFCLKKNLNYHLKTVHQLQIAIKSNQICVLCDQMFTRVKLLHEHLQNDHTVPLNFIDETFYLEKDFLDWKKKIEKENHSFYTLRDTRVDRGITISNYNCHRSGPYKMKQNRVRKAKASGSIKTGGTCPAVIKVSTQTVGGISEIKVRWQSVHLGHDLDTHLLRLTKEERENLAACLKLGISMDKILQQARQNTSPANRYRLLTRRHLHNIRRDFKIPLNNDKPKKARAMPTSNVKARVSNVKEREINHKEIKEHENKSAVSSLLLQQNNIFSEQFNMNKIHNILEDFGMHVRSEKPQKASALQTSNVEASDNSNGYEDCVEMEGINHEEMQEHEKNSTVSSPVLQQNHDVSSNNEKLQKASGPPTSNVEASGSNNCHKDYVETEGRNYEEIKEHGKNLAVSSPLLQKNNDSSEQFNMRKMQIFNQLTELRSRIEKWDPQCPLPNVEDQFKSINVWLDISASMYKVGDSNLVFAQRNKPASKRRKLKKDSKKSKIN